MPTQYCVPGVISGDRPKSASLYTLCHPLVTSPINQPPKGDKPNAAAACFTEILHRQVPREAAPPRNRVMVGHRLQTTSSEPTPGDARGGL